MPKTDIKNTLEKLLKLQTTPPDFYIPLGKFCLTQDLQLALKVLDEFAQKTNLIPSYEEFVELHREIKFREEEPKIDDPKFKTSSSHLPPKIRQAKQLYFFAKAKKIYLEKLAEHNTLQKRIHLITQRKKPTPKRYILFVCNPDFTAGHHDQPRSLNQSDRNFFTTPHTLHIKESDRAKHTYITAQTGHGKSVTIETIIYQYLIKKDQQEALILLDPHGDLAQNCARLLPNLHNDRLLYIKPGLNRNLTPTLNPFTIKNLHWDDINKASESIIEVFQELMKADQDGSSFTPQMVTILKPCISTLLHLENTTFSDLVDFLSEDPNDYKTLLHSAKNLLTNPMQLDGLQKDFLKDSYRPSKLSIKTKLRNLLNDDYFYNFLVGENSFDLEHAIDNKKFIIFDLSDLTKKSKSAIGRFIMATITNIALARTAIPEHDRTPLHLFVDECQNFISSSIETILTETRKFKLHGTFAQQFVGQGMDTKLKKAVIGNSFIKIIGNSGVADLRTMKEETGIPVDLFQTLEQGNYYIHTKGRPPVRVKIPLIGEKEKMTPQQWQTLLNSQIKRFYRPLNSSTATNTTAEKQAPYSTAQNTGKKLNLPDF